MNLIVVINAEDLCEGVTPTSPLHIADCKSGVQHTCEAADVVIDGNKGYVIKDRNMNFDRTTAERIAFLLKE